MSNINQELEQLKKEKAQLQSQLAKIDSRLANIELILEDECWHDLSEQYNVQLQKGTSFSVTKAICEYCHSKGFDTGYYRVWQIGQIANITHFHTIKDEPYIRAQCYTGHDSEIKSGGHSFGFTKLMSLSTPIPAQLIVDAIKNND